MENHSLDGTLKGMDLRTERILTDSIDYLLYINGKMSLSFGIQKGCDHIKNIQFISYGNNMTFEEAKNVIKIHSDGLEQLESLRLFEREWIEKEFDGTYLSIHEYMRQHDALREMVMDMLNTPNIFSYDAVEYRNSRLKEMVDRYFTINHYDDRILNNIRDFALDHDMTVVMVGPEGFKILVGMNRSIFLGLNDGVNIDGNILLNRCTKKNLFENQLEYTQKRIKSILTHPADLIINTSKL